MECSVALESRWHQVDQVTGRKSGKSITDRGPGVENASTRGNDTEEGAFYPGCFELVTLVLEYFGCSEQIYHVPRILLQRPQLGAR